MEMKRTMTMNWDGLGSHDDDDDNFFDSNNRISAVVPMDLLAAMASSEDSSDDEFEDPRMSFATDVGGRLSTVSLMQMPPLPLLPQSDQEQDYDVWMAAPTSIQERRKRLLQGMGLNSSKELIRLRTMAMSKKVMGMNAPPLPPSAQGGSKGSKINIESKKFDKTDNNVSDGGGVDNPGSGSPSGETETPDTDSDNHPFVLIRSRSDGDIFPFSIETKKRKEQLIGKVSKQRLTRTLSTLVPFARLCKLNYDSTTTNSTNNNNNGKEKNGKKARAKARTNHKKSSTGGEQLGAFFLIKNLDTGKEFIVKEFNEDGMWNKFSDLQTGRQLTMEEFEQSVGYSPVVKELMRRENVRLNGGEGGGGGLERKTSVNAYLSKSFRYSKRRGVSLLKNINKVANSVTSLGTGHEKDLPDVPVVPVQVTETPHKGGKGNNTNTTAAAAAAATTTTTNNNNPASSEWVRVRSQGKAYKDLTALRLCQEIQAHEGSIWAMKFSVDGRYLASAGEDKVIHIWEVQECEIASLKPPDEAGNSTPLHPMFCPSPDRDKPPLAPDLSTLDKKKKGKSASRKGGLMPDYVKLPDTVFSLSSDPVCSFIGHLDDVLDLSWSSKNNLLSSSMDKTVRLWDVKTKACLKLFAHNDYVTCIQFNPVNDDYFISGSLDAKVRVWNVSGRRVVDWTDLHEMVTAACYTPDGQGAAVGSHKGNCRMYSITDGKLNQLSQFDVQNKKKAVPKKITGFQFMPETPNEVLVTSADSRIRIYDGSDVLQKFRGFRNTSSQIAASFSPDGKYVICGSEDSNVYVWKREEPKNTKTKTTIDTKSYEHFPCKDVSVAIPWPGSLKFEPPTIQLHPKKNAKKPTATSSPKKDDPNKNSKRHLPPLPNKKKTDNNENNNGDENVDGDKAPESPVSSDPSGITRTESGIGDSFDSTAGASIRYGDSPSISSSNAASASWSSGWSWFDGGGSHGGDTMQARAWGLVIVTAGFGGEIRAYQNFGVPLRVGRQTNLF